MTGIHDPATPLTMPQARAVVHRHIHAAHPPRSRPPGLPSLGSYLRQVREHIIVARTGRALPRERAAHRIGLSVSYLKQIETDIRTPTAEALRLLAEGYHLDPGQVELVACLREPAQPLPDQAAMQDLLHADPALTHRLTDLDRAGILTAYFDPLWNLLCANTAFEQHFPGAAAAGNWVGWHFTAAARARLLDWEREATAMVHLLKPGLARHRTSAAAAQLLDQLHAHDGFAERWDTPAVAYTRRTHPRTTLTNGRGTIELRTEATFLDTFPVRLHHYLATARPSQQPQKRDSAHLEPQPSPAEVPRPQS